MNKIKKKKKDKERKYGRSRYENLSEKESPKNYHDYLEVIIKSWKKKYEKRRKKNHISKNIYLFLDSAKNIMEHMTNFQTFLKTYKTFHSKYLKISALDYLVLEK